MIPFDITQFQPRAWSILARSYASKRVAGTYLLCGPDGCGRWPLAITFAALLNCETPVTDADNVMHPCGECRNCRVVFGLNHEGLYFALPLPPHKNSDQAVEQTSAVLDMKRHEPFGLLDSTASLTIPIDVSRQIKRSVASRASDGVFRMVIFYQMERMRPEAADALLKLIEEPPPRTVIMLAAEKAERLLSTIQSRSQKIVLQASPFDAVAAYLTDRYDLSEKKAALLARISEGNVGRAVEMADADDDGDSSRRAVGFRLFKSLFDDRMPDTVSHVVDSIGERNRGEAEHLLYLWQSLLRDCNTLAVTGDDTQVVNIDFTSELRRLSDHFNDPRLVARAAENIKITLAHFRRNVHIHGALAALVLKVKSDIR